MPFLLKYKLVIVLMNTGFLGGILTIYFLIKGFSYSQIGIYTAISTIGFFLFEVPTGVVADKISRKTSVLIGWILSFLGSLLLLYLKNFVMLILYGVITSIGITFISGVLQA
ncbi:MULTISPECIES: MFS transporter [unclassified Thermococcus]|uniref:MFS transporter n=1 Tax=unclassified Thermococcus TaxID=2627626 RepID=UPI001F0D7CEE|nr:MULTISPECIES: MFS transporter [unclassified Thermococcus]